MHKFEEMCTKNMLNNKAAFVRVLMTKITKNENQKIFTETV